MIPPTQTTTETPMIAVQGRYGRWHGRKWCAICSVRLTKRHKCKEPGQSLWESLENSHKLFNPAYRRQSWENYKKYGIRPGK